jgi:hypothetical protein
MRRSAYSAPRSSRRITARVRACSVSRIGVCAPYRVRPTRVLRNRALVSPLLNQIDLGLTEATCADEIAVTRLRLPGRHGARPRRNNNRSRARPDVFVGDQIERSDFARVMTRSAVREIIGAISFVNVTEGCADTSVSDVVADAGITRQPAMRPLAFKALRREPRRRGGSDVMAARRLSKACGMVCGTYRA